MEAAKIFPLLNFMSKKMESKLELKWFSFSFCASQLNLNAWGMRMGADTNLHKCILVQLGPTVNPSNDDSRLVCETFSFRRNVHHTPFCSAAVPLIRFFNFTTPIYCYEEERRGA